MDGTIAKDDYMIDIIKGDLEFAEAASEKTLENAGELRKVNAALKRAAALRDLLEKAEAGRWTDDEPKRPKPEEAPGMDGRPAVDSKGRRLYDFIAQGSRALDGKMICSGYFADDAMVSFAMGLATGLRDRCKKAEIRVFTPNGRGGNTLVRVQR